jgi:hypothetical protein
MIQVGIQQVLAPAPIEVQETDNASLVKQVKQLGQWALIPSTTKIFTEMVVCVEGGEARLLHRGCFSNHFGVGVKILKEHGL